MTVKRVASMTTRIDRMNEYHPTPPPYRERILLGCGTFGGAIWKMEGSSRDTGCGISSHLVNGSRARKKRKGRKWIFFYHKIGFKKNSRPLPREINCTRRRLCSTFKPAVFYLITRDWTNWSSVWRKQWTRVLFGERNCEIFPTFPRRL